MPFTWGKRRNNGNSLFQALFSVLYMAELPCSSQPFYVSGTTVHFAHLKTGACACEVKCFASSHMTNKLWNQDLNSGIQWSNIQL